MKHYKYIESDLEEAILEWFEEDLGYSVAFGPDIAFDGEHPERQSYKDVVLVDRLRSAVVQINSNIPRDAQEEAIKKVISVAYSSSNLLTANQAFHKMLTEGIDVEYAREDLPAPRPDLYFVYAILCENGSFYIGQTQDLNKRWKEHNNGTGADYTKNFKPRLLAHYEEYKTREDAVKREHELKTGFGRKWLKREWEAGRTRQAGGTIAGDKVYLFDVKNLNNNDWLAVNQFTVIENNHNPADAKALAGTRRPDVMIFVNGLPIAIFELKNPADASATLKSAFNQIQTYKTEIPSLFAYNEICVLADHVKSAVVGTISADMDRFVGWKSIDGHPSTALRTGKISKTNDLEILIKGIFAKERLLDIVKNFIVFESEKDSKNNVSKIIKKLSAYHQYFAVNKAVQETLRASGQLPSSNFSQREKDYRGNFQFSGLIDKALEMRKNQTKTEEIVWGILRNSQFLGLKFRRQHQIGEYIVDFYCNERKLIIEIDGGIHNAEEQVKKDHKRDAYLQSIGNIVLRFKNEEIENSLDEVLSKISNFVSSPSGRGQGEGYADKRVGVIWHTQGSGKSLSMVFYAGKIIQALDNPTLVLLTDRNDLDGQLFGVFSHCSDLIRQTPKQAQDRSDLKKLLSVASGGVVFTTIQKFMPSATAPSPQPSPNGRGRSEAVGEGNWRMPVLSDRKNIIVIADEAHRSQYDFIDGFARHMHDALPNASFIGFTGTPIELSDKNTRAVFGEYIDVYDITRAVEDKATVPIYYEARLAKIDLLKELTPKIDAEFEELTEGEEVEKKEKLKSKWARLEAMIGSEKRVALIAKDVVDHFEARLGVMDGKGMFVSMSRRIAVELYDEIIKLRPGWHSDDIKKGFIKVVMTGSASDPANYQKHIHTKDDRNLLADRMKDPKDELKLVIVRDMWLTGFDAPSMHTMYIDKPMQGHGLMQAIARVNRVYKDKPGGLIVDYLGIAPSLKEALSYYTQEGKEAPTVKQEDAISIMLEKYETVKAMYHGFDYSGYFSDKARNKAEIAGRAMDHILGMENGKKRYLQSVAELSQSFALSVPSNEALNIRDEVAFFQTVRAFIAKFEQTGGLGGPTMEDYDQAIRQIVSDAVTSDKVINIFDAAGLKNPNVAVLSDEFLEEVQGLERKNVALEVLKRLLNDEIRTMEKKFLVKSRSFAKMLEETIKKYQNQTIEAAQVIAELVELAKKIREEKNRGGNLNLTEDEVAFYDALCESDSAVMELGDDTLKKIAQELVAMLRKNTSIDWTLKQSVQAKLRVLVKKLLNKYKYPPDKQELATKTVLEQAEVLCKDWSGE